MPTHDTRYPSSLPGQAAPTHDLTQTPIDPVPPSIPTTITMLLPQVSAKQFQNIEAIDYRTKLCVGYIALDPAVVDHPTSRLAFAQWLRACAASIETGHFGPPPGSLVLLDGTTIEPCASAPAKSATMAKGPEGPFYVALFDSVAFLRIRTFETAAEARSYREGWVECGDAYRNHPSAYVLPEDEAMMLEVELKAEAEKAMKAWAECVQIDSVAAQKDGG